MAIVPPHHAVEGVALHGGAPRRTDHVDELGAAELLRRVDAGGVTDALLDDGAVEVVHAERERDLRELEPDVYPEGLDVVEVVENKSRGGEDLEVVDPGGPGSVLNPVFAG